GEATIASERDGDMPGRVPGHEGERDTDQEEATGIRTPQLSRRYRLGYNLPPRFSVGSQGPYLQVLSPSIVRERERLEVIGRGHGQMRVRRKAGTRRPAANPVVNRRKFVELRSPISWVRPSAARRRQAPVVTPIKCSRQGIAVQDIATPATMP